MSSILPFIYKGLSEKCNYWNATVEELAKGVMKIYVETDPRMVEQIAEEVQQLELSKKKQRDCWTERHQRMLAEIEKARKSKRNR